MPLNYAFDEELGLLSVRYSGLIQVEEIIDAIPAMGELATQSPSYAVLLLFDDKVDLSTIGMDELKRIKQTEQDAYRDLKLKRRASAAVLARSVDARVLMPLWNALSEIDTEPGFRYKAFRQPEEAFDWLGVPRDRGRELIARAVPAQA